MYVLSATAVDSSGNSNTTTRIVTVNNPDLIPPTVNITFPKNGSKVPVTYGNVTIIATATDNVAVKQVQFFVNSKPLGIDTTPPYNATTSTLGKPKGSYVLTATATDTSNNNATSTPVIITLY